MRRFIIICSIFFMTACGFHLRGSQGSAVLPFKTLSIVGDTGGQVAQNLTNLMRSQVTMVAAPAPAQVIVELGKTEYSKAISAKDSQGRTIEYRMYANVTMQAYAANKDQLIQPVTLNMTRTLSTGNGYDTGIDLEQSRMNADMDSELANLIQYRLRAIKLHP